MVTLFSLIDICVDIPKFLSKVSFHIILSIEYGSFGLVWSLLPWNENGCLNASNDCSPSNCFDGQDYFSCCTSGK